MNVRPGDIARVVHPSMYGLLVTVLYEAPKGRYVLPDGFPAFNQVPDEVCWVFEFMGSRQEVPLGISTRMSRYAACRDKWLRQIRDDEGDDESLTWAGKPEQITA